MPVGVVVLEAFIDPDYGLGAKRLGESRLSLLCAPAVAVRIEQRLPRGEDGALAVVIHRASLQDEIELQNWPARKLGNVVADGRIVREVELAPPGIGFESDGDRRAAAPGEDRPGIAEPDIAVAGAHHLGRVTERRSGRGFRPGIIT